MNLEELFVDEEGGTWTYTQMMAFTKLKRPAISRRIGSGWSMDDVLHTPYRGVPSGKGKPARDCRVKRNAPRGVDTRPDTRDTLAREIAPGVSLQSAMSGKTIGGDIPTKTCKKCKSAKPLSEYHKQKNYTDGLDGTCKVCRLSRKREQYLAAKNPVVPKARKPTASDKLLGWARDLPEHRGIGL